MNASEGAVVSELGEVRKRLLSTAHGWRARAGFGEAAGIPDNEYVVGTIWFGQAAGDAPPAPPKRLALGDVLIRHE